MEIKETNIQTLTEWYNKNKKPFVNYLLSRYDQLRVEDAEDIFQEACISMYENIKSKKLVELSCSAFTYLLRIGINKANNIFNRKIYIEPIDDNINISHCFFTDDDNVDEEKIKIICEAVDSASKSSCKDILWGYYRDKLNMTDLAILLNHKHADTVKSLKSRCIKNLKSLVINRFKERGLI